MTATIHKDQGLFTSQLVHALTDRIEPVREDLQLPMTQIVPDVQEQLDSVTIKPFLNDNAKFDQPPLQPESVKSQLTTTVDCEQN